MFLSQFFSALLADKLPPDQLRWSTWLVFLFVVVAALGIVFGAPEMSSSEVVHYEMVEEFLAQSEFKTDQLNYAKVNKYIDSLPMRLGASLELTGRVTLIRVWRLLFLVATLWLTVQTAKRIFPQDNFIPLAAGALLATNNHMLTSIRIGGNIFSYFLFALIVYVFVEVAAEGSLTDISIGLILLFLLSRIDALAAQRIIVPVFFLAVVTALVFTFKGELGRYLPASNQARLATGLATVLTLTVVGWALKPVALWLQAPASLWTAFVGLPSWPAVADHLVRLFGESPALPEGFKFLQTLRLYLFQLAAAAGLAGIIRFLYVSVTEKIEVVPKTGNSPANESAANLETVVASPDNSILASIDIPALLVTAFIPLTAVAAANGYSLPAAIDEGFTFVLLLPLTILLAAGLRQLSAVKSLETVMLFCLVGVLTLNISGILIPILWQ